MPEANTNTVALIARVDHGKVKLAVTDEPLHTAEHPYCKDHTCPCHIDEQESRERLPLNGNRPFSLLR